MIVTLCRFFLGLVLVLCWSEMSFAQQSPNRSDVRIAWDYSSMQQLAPQGGYPRMKRLRNGDIWVIYENRKGDIHWIKSIDNGVTWSAFEVLFSSYSYSIEGKDETISILAANPELIELDNGDILFACNYRPSSDGVAPFSIGLKKLDHLTHRLSEVEILYQAGKKFIDGCWEPSFLQLPNGEVHIYFANEIPSRETNEQEISVLKSNDYGSTWSVPQTASFRKERRDGMPVTYYSKDQIYLAIEDNKIDQFKPYIIKTDVKDSWKKPVLANSENRWYALEEPVDDSIYMGAPYLIKLPNDQFLLSYQTNRDRNHNWEHSTMEVAIGNRGAKAFKNISQPFALALNKEAKWNSLAIWDESTVVALSSTNFASDKISPWLIKGYLIANSVNLNLDTAELFIGHHSLLSLKVKIFKDEEFLRLVLAGDKLDSNQGLKVKEYILFIHGNQTRRISIPPHELEKHIRLSELPPNFYLGMAIKYENRSGEESLETLVQMDEMDPKTWIKIEL